MTSPMDTKMDTVPYSAEAVDNLVAIEREHEGNWGYTFSEDKSGIGLLCFYCSHPIPRTEIFKFSDPCPTLVEARASADPATKVAVALVMGGDKK